MQRQSPGATYPHHNNGSILNQDKSHLIFPVEDHKSVGKLIKAPPQWAKGQNCIMHQQTVSKNKIQLHEDIPQKAAVEMYTQPQPVLASSLMHQPSAETFMPRNNFVLPSNNAAANANANASATTNHPKHQPSNAKTLYGTTELPPTSNNNSESSYVFGRVLGTGSFGIVYQAHHLETGDQVAIKKVLQDPKYKNRELDIMKELGHPNVVNLVDFFFTESKAGTGLAWFSDTSQRFLNVVMEYVPDTVYRVLRTFVRMRKPLPMILVRAYIYQLCRSVGYLHKIGICHRDIKPQNLLVDTKNHLLKLCDFGSAKRLNKNEHSVAYICSRFYRAPELMLGATEYTTAIDIWSVGCVLGELLLGRPLFSGETSVDQLVKIIQVLGTPSQRQMQAMNSNYREFQFPDVPARNWRDVMHNAVGGPDNIPNEALDLLDAFLKYEPENRLNMYEALAHPFFDPLREPNIFLRDDVDLPDFFNFKVYEFEWMSPECQSIVIPRWVKRLRFPSPSCSEDSSNNNNNNNTNSAVCTPNVIDLSENNVAAFINVHSSFHRGVTECNNDRVSLSSIPD